jgi:hypothetical protein
LDTGATNEQLDLRRRLESLSEAQLHQLLRELLVEMGYSNVSVRQGNDEHGRDVVFSETDRLNRTIWRGIQAKVRAPTGSKGSGGLTELVNQCEAGLNHPLIVHAAVEVSVREMWIVCSREITAAAVESIRGKPTLAGRVEIIDGPRLQDFVRRYLPQYSVDTVAPAQTYLRDLAAYCDRPEDYLVARFGVRIPLESRYVTPIMSVRVVTGSVLDGCASTAASRAVGLSELTQRAAAIRRLGRASLVPGLWHARSKAILRSLNSFQRSCQELKAVPLSDSLALAGKLAELAELLQVRVDREDDALGTGLAARATVELFEQTAGDFLESVYERYPIVAPIVMGTKPISARAWTWLRLARAKDRVHPVPRRRGDSPEARAPGGVLRMRAYDDFYTELVGAYTAAEPQSHAQLIDELAIHFLNGSRTSARPENSDALAAAVCEEVAQMVDAHAALVVAQCRGLLGDQNASDPDVAALTLARLSDALCGVFDIREENLARVTLQQPTRSLQAVRRIVFIGQLGAGKSTALKRAVREAVEAHKNGTSRVLPAFVLLSGVSLEARGKVQDDVRKSAVLSGSLPALPQTDTHWLLDGLDEMQASEGRRRVIQWLSGHQPEMPTRAWLATRPAALPHSIPEMLTVYIDGFGRVEVSRFVDRFPWSSARGRISLQEALDASPELTELARSPLFLTLLALLSDVQNFVRLPRRRDGLYDRIVNLFLGDWDRAKGIPRTYAVEEQGDRLALLARAAHHLYSRRLGKFTAGDFIEAYARHLPETYVEPQSVARACFDELVHDSLLLRQPDGQFAFFHLSIHEYLASVDLLRDVSLTRVWEAVREYFWSGWWEEVLVFYATSKRDVGPLVTELNQHRGGDSTGRRLRTLLTRWLSVADFTDVENVQPMGREVRVLWSTLVGEMTKGGIRGRDS